MVVPALPSSQSSGAVAPVSWADDVRDLLEFLRDDRPLFRGRAVETLFNSGVTNERGFGVGASTFSNTPITNVGGFTVSSSANTSSQYNLEVPEAGYYEGFWNVEFAAGTTGTRILTPQYNSAGITGTSISSDPTSAGVKSMSVPFAVDCSVDDELSLDITHSNGSGLNTIVTLFVRWIHP